jgi:acyl carrier protein
MCAIIRTDQPADKGGSIVAKIGDRICTFISSEILFEGDSSAITEDTELIGSVLDSLSLMQLVAFIEEEWDVVVDDEEVTAENFRTVADVERLVTSKSAAG